MSCITETSEQAERAFEADRLVCRDCGDCPAYDDWETLEGKRLCAECADDRAERRMARIGLGYLHG